MKTSAQIIEEAVDTFVEEGANLEHDRWARWQKYMFSKGNVCEDGNFHLPKEFVDRWFRKIDTKYADLSEEEKESYRKETRNYLPLLRTSLSKAMKTSVEEVRSKEKCDPMKTGINPAYAMGYNAAVSNMEERRLKFFEE